MNNDQILGIIFSILGIIGMASNRLDFANLTVPALVSFGMFAVGLYLVLKRV
ncbi:MAG: hypothetical protein J4469_04945 [Candidatus Aenigmarchaeota archaeon]|nr:hypothetical protein [Candidatus Aenigmarchaeota archaeon]